MIKFENTDVLGWDHAIRGMRNPLNSWDRTDTDYYKYYDTAGNFPPNIGQNDYDLMKRLRNAGTDHRKFMRMITVYVDIVAPLFWWKEADTYKVGTVVNSCSTMHCIHKKEFTLDDFSTDHLIDEGDASTDEYGRPYAPRISNSVGLLCETIRTMNYYRDKYINARKDENKKQYWWQMIQLLPTSYNQKRTVMLNYEVLANIYKSRKDHKLDEWHEFCDWIKELPYSEFITGEYKEN